MMRYFITSLYLVFFTIATFAQDVTISGVVADINHKALSDVIVKVSCETATMAYTTTDVTGNYSLSFSLKSAGDKPVSISFLHISFEEETEILPKDKEIIHKDILLIPKSIELKEVTVKVNPLYVRGDTLRYNLVSFLGKGDITLEDGLKRLPGVDVSNNGTIKYMGRNISNFYIEGMDMLGSRYNLATRNIPAQYITQIELLRHHNDRKVDADEQSDDVAINVKLSRKAKFKPFGQPTIGIGVREDDPIAALGLTGMMFSADFQLLASAKYSDNVGFGLDDLYEHKSGTNVEALASSLLKAWEGGFTPIGDYRYERNGYASLNGIRKRGEDRTLRVNANYAYNRSHNMYSAQTVYFADGQNISVGETENPFSITHKPSLEMRYVRNSDDNYTLESLDVRGSFEENDNPVLRAEGANSILNTQHRDATILNVQNEFSTTVKRGDRKYRLSSVVAFCRAPEVLLQMNDISQRAQSTMLTTRHGTSLQYGVDKWRFSIPLNLDADYNFVETELSGAGNKDNAQRLTGWTLLPMAIPSADWYSADNRIYLAMTMGLKWLNMHYKLTSARMDVTDFSQFYIEPSLKLNYTISGTSEISFDSRIINNTGDILGLLTSPLQKDYRNSSVASGIIGKTQNWITNIDYKYQIPFSYLSLTAGAMWNQGKRNVLSSQMVDGSDVSMSNIVRDSRYESANANFGITKNFISINTKVEAKATVRWNHTESMSQQRLVNTYSEGYSLLGKAVVNPVKWTEISGYVTYSKSFTRFGGVHNDYDNLKISGVLALYPTEKLEIKASYDFVRSQISTTQHNDASMLHSSIQYKAKRSTWKLSLNNLLDTRHYSYITYNGNDRYTYDCLLIGRTIILSCVFNL